MGFLNLSLDRVRQIQTANYSYFKTPVCHPKRLLNVHDLVYLHQGEWRIGQDDCEYLLRAGDCILLSASRRHYGPEPCRAETRTRYIHFYPAEDDCFSATAETALSSERIALPVVVSCGSDGRIQRLFEEIIHLVWSSVKLNPVMARIKLNELLACLAAKSAAQASPGADAVAYAVGCIEQSPDRPFSINDLSAHCGVSRRYLTQEFRKKTGTSIHQFQLNLKVQRAASLLESAPHLAVKEIAAQLNFYDEFHFSRLFRQRMGVSPSGYRKRQAV